jgi:DNA-binding transcriptional regulator YhcF (GntR family)
MIGATVRAGREDGQAAEPPLPALDGPDPLFVQIKRAIARQILRGERRAGDRLPNEVQLAVQFGVSRQTVHEAIALLAREGLLVRRRRAGTFVAMGRQEINPTVDPASMGSARVTRRLSGCGWRLRCGRCAALCWVRYRWRPGR